MSATPSVKRSQFMPGKDPGTFAVKVDAASVLSIQKNGDLETRPIGSIGAWESGRDQQNKWVVSDPAYPTGSYAILIADE